MADDNVLKALVDETLERADVHPDRRAVLQEWRDENTSDEEKESRLTDEEREANRQDEGRKEADKLADQEKAKSSGDGEPPTPKRGR